MRLFYNSIHPPAAGQKCHYTGKTVLILFSCIMHVVTQKGGLAFHGIPHHLGKHMRMCL